MNQHANSAGSELDPSIPAIGDVIAEKYRIESVVGTGGMGVVLCAVHLALGQKVAIKVLTVADDDARLDEARERFLREGRATAALVSDHVVRVYDVGTLAGGAPFMVMELLRGRDLARVLQQNGPFDLELACECVAQAAEAIACAHAQGIVHRDLKPSNLFLTERNDGKTRIVVLDFGISKAMNASLEAVAPTLTLDRSVLGTPFYMSPEQVRDAKKVDARTDIWSLGLILHELLAGSPAFEGSTLPGICAAITADAPAALRLKRPEVPVELEAVVLKCLEKDPGRRFQTARELIEQLAKWTGLGHDSKGFGVRPASLRGELSELRDGSTVSLAPDTGTLASAVFTKSGPRRLIADAARAPDDASPARDATASPARGRRTGYAVTIAAAAIAVLAVTAWRVLKESPTSNAILNTAPSAPSASLVQAPSHGAFSLQIDSSPPGADVYEADVRLGSTPMRISIDSDANRAPHSFTLRKPGYLPYSVVQGASAVDTRVFAALAPEAMPVSATSSTHGSNAAPPRAPASPPAPARHLAGSATKSGASAVHSAAPTTAPSDIFMQR